MKKKIDKSLFTKRTRILTYDDEAETLIRKLGNNHLYLVNALGHRVLLDKVTLNPCTPYLIRLQANGHTLECSFETLIGVSTHHDTTLWIQAEDIKRGMNVLMYDGTYPVESVEVLAVSRIGFLASLSLDKGSTFFANGFAVKTNIIEIDEENEIDDEEDA